MRQAEVNEKGREALVGARRRGGGTAPRKRGAGIRSAEFWRWAALGFLLGMLAAVAGTWIGLRAVPVFRPLYAYPLAGLVGALLAVTRLRPLLLGGAAAVCAGILAIAYLPLVDGRMASLVRQDPLEKVEAVVVLSSNVSPEGVPDVAFLQRALRAYELIGEGFARRLVVTRLKGKPSYAGYVQRQMDRLGLDAPVDETAPIQNTHDEAVEVARLGRQRGWKKVLLVSEPTHMRRAGAVFERAGLPVICAPSLEGEYRPQARTLLPGERLNAFQDWLWEVVGYEMYRRRGWI